MTVSQRDDDAGAIFFDSNVSIFWLLRKIQQMNEAEISVGQDLASVTLISRERLWKTDLPPPYLHVSRWEIFGGVGVGIR